VLFAILLISTTEFNVRWLQSSTMVIGATVSSSSLLQEQKMAQLSAINLILISFYLNNSSIPGIWHIHFATASSSASLTLLAFTIALFITRSYNLLIAFVLQVIGNSD
jgi:hypothetical protein